MTMTMTMTVTVTVTIAIAIAIATVTATTTTTTTTITITITITIIKMLFNRELTSPKVLFREALPKKKNVKFEIVKNSLKNTILKCSINYRIKTS